MSQGPPEVPSELGLTRPHGSRKRPRTPSQTHRLTHQLSAVTLSWLHVEFASYEEIAILGEMLGFHLLSLNLVGQDIRWKVTLPP